ncbi:MAG: methyltransferase domain-containing protein [Kiloniellaceae bacterium]|nr:methyltransferase domain-containing protein [Kiloniellaceae bacterium]
MIRPVEFSRLADCPICGSDQLESHNQRREFAQNKTDCFVFDFDDCVCAGCGFVVSRNRPSEAALDDYYKGYLRSLSNVAAAEIDQRVEILTPFLPARARILEIGGGRSSFADKLTTLGHEVFQEDPSTISEAGGSDSGFDLICSYYVGEHVLDVNGWIDFQKKLLRPQGRVLIEVPNFARHLMESMNNEHINHFQMKHLRQLLGNHGIAVVAASEDEVGRYFGMWAIGEVAAAGTPAGNIDDEAPATSRKMVAQARKQLEERTRRFAAIMHDAKRKMAAGTVVGFWPCNEVTTNILMQAPDVEAGQLRLFDIDGEKHSIDWCSLGRNVQQPERQAVAGCGQLYLCSPSRNEEIAKAIAAMEIGDVTVTKVPFS